MPYKTGQWGEQAKARHQKRKDEGYWRKYYQKKKMGDVDRRATVGNIGEAISRLLMPSADFVDESGYDSIIGDSVKIEVKCSSWLPDFGGYKFSISPAQLDTCHFALLIALTPDGDLFSYWLVPSNELRRSIRIRDTNLERFAPYLVGTK